MNDRLKSILVLMALQLAATAAVRADVQLPGIFGNHMVLQQDTKLPIWGTAESGEKVTVTVGDKTGSTTAAADGKWRVDLAPLVENSKPVTVTITGKNTIKFDDVLVGDVWVCSGQSNMDFTFSTAHNFATEDPKADDPQLRLYHVPQGTKLDPQSDVKGHWDVCQPGSVKGFSAVAYFFGRELRSTLNRPIGLIQSSVGGTPAQAWTSLEGLKKDPELKQYVDKHDQMVAAFPVANAAYPALFATYQADLATWDKEVGATYTPAFEAWKKDAETAKAAGQPIPSEPMPSRPKPHAPPDPNGSAGMPTVLYNAMIAPLIPYGIKGAIWYQGEGNVGLGSVYKILFGRMITQWRENWGEGNFPFLFVQLAANGKTGPYDSWPFLREAQLKTLELPNTGMASAVDLGDPTTIHPRDKMDVGHRLALAAEHVAYGQKLVYSGPIYDAVKYEGTSARISFTQIGGGLIIGAPPWLAPTSKALPSDKLIGFRIAGADQQWVDADAKIDGDSVVVSSPQVAKPVAVRYAWYDYPLANLYNKENLPASPFRTDDWPRAKPGAAAPKPLVPPADATEK